MPGKRNSMRGGAKSSGNSTDRNIVNSHKLTGSTTTIIESDLSAKRQNFNIVQRPPKNMSNQIFWCQFSTEITLSTSNVTFVENNLAFALNTWPENTQAIAFFDQYCLYSVTAAFSSIANSSATQPIRVHTAIDYDSNTAAGSIAAIQNFGSYAMLALSADGNTSGIRYLKPCLAPQVTSASLIPVPGGIGRAWLDAAYPSAVHYGLRIITDTWLAAASNVVNVVLTCVAGFRNNI